MRKPAKIEPDPTCAADGCSRPFVTRYWYATSPAGYRMGVVTFYCEEEHGVEFGDTQGWTRFEPAPRLT